MLNTPRAYRGMITSPHHLASEAGLRILREGGNAIEAAIATVAALSVVYPHMTGIGGDGFWLVSVPVREVVAIDASGGAARAATAELYRGYDAIPQRGPLAANTVAGTLSGWDEALRLSREQGGSVPLSRLVEDAVWYAEHGFPVTVSQAELTASKLPELEDAPGFKDMFLIDGRLPRLGERMRLPALGRTLRRLGDVGIDDFYRGELARAVAADLARCGSPVAAEDLAAHTAERRRPLNVPVSGATLFNFPPPTQGLASLIILALFDRLGIIEPESFAFVHGLVEAAKQAFLVRDRVIGHPGAMTEEAEAFLTPAALERMAGRIDREKALPWPAPPSAGDTVWLGAVDAQGLAVSFIQSIYFEFGSGTVLPETGIHWQNRGSSLLLTAQGPRRLAAGHKPFHTLNPALARFDDGRVMVYGTMGGEGQPQTQSAIFTRYACFGQGLQEAITAPRWLLGKTWGENSVTLKLESRFAPDVVQALREAGHDVEMLGPFTSTMGHAGAIVRHSDGLLEGATDPRSDGSASGF
jgi:gamma-glutamyltranspeptidase/glutathione hydrolase